jgi:hypothetical protein
MRFLTIDECREWARKVGFRLEESGSPPRPSTDQHHVRRDIPTDYTRLTWFCRHLERSLQPREACLLWVTDWNIWEENLHLYYRLRQSYGDPRLLHEAPGHLFLGYEGPDLVSFLEVAVLCGWDAHLLPGAGYARAFVSHDEFVEFAADDSNPSIAEEFGAGLSASSPDAAA